MECPYCKGELKDGKIITFREWPYWLEEGKERRSVGEAVTGAGNLPGKTKLMNIEIAGTYCPKCRKLIIHNADLG